MSHRNAAEYDPRRPPTGSSSSFYGDRNYGQPPSTSSSRYESSSRSSTTTREQPAPPRGYPDRLSSRRRPDHHHHRPRTRSRSRSPDDQEYRYEKKSRDDSYHRDYDDEPEYKAKKRRISLLREDGPDSRAAVAHDDDDEDEKPTTATATQPPPLLERLEAERRARMTRLRAENDLEEQALDPQPPPGTAGGSQDHRVDPQQEIVTVQPEEWEQWEEEEQMQRLLGFTGGFGSTKGQAVADNRTTAARGTALKNQARKYRQYMNRKNGFNRPLDKMD